jgi:hypothetical protein
MGISFTNDSATISTTEYSLPNDSTSLTPQTDDALLQAWIDFGAMIAGDEYEWKVYEKVAGSGATQRVIATGRLLGAQASPVVTPTLVVGEGWDVTVKRIAGADRSIGWSLRKVT